MYLCVLIIPLVGSILGGLLGRKLGATGTQLLTTVSVLAATVLAYLTYYEVALLENTVTLDITS